MYSLSWFCYPRECWLIHHHTHTGITSHMWPLNSCYQASDWLLIWFHFISFTFRLHLNVLIYGQLVAALLDSTKAETANDMKCHRRRKNMTEFPWASSGRGGSLRKDAEESLPPAVLSTLPCWALSIQLHLSSIQFFHHQPTQSFSANDRLRKASPSGLPVTGAWAVLELPTGSTWNILATKGELFSLFSKSAKEQEAMFNCCLPRSDAHSCLLVGVFQNNRNKSDVM